MSLHEVCINTSRQAILYRDFVIEESRDGWEWTHAEYDRVTNPITGLCQTVFDCITAVDHFYDEQSVAA